MLKKVLKILISLLIGGIFLWLAFRNVDFNELTTYLKTMNYGWLGPYFFMVIVSHYARAGRWMLLLEEKKGVQIKKQTLFTGVMLGYLVNYAVPRLGEVSRSVYVSKKEDIDVSTLIGTVVLERIIDLICLIIIMLIVAFYLISDVQILYNIFGERMINYIQNFYTFYNLLLLAAVGLAAIGVVWGLFYTVEYFSKKYHWIANLYDKFQQLNRTFLNGLMALRNVKNWWAFGAWTILIWTGYILLVYIPFSMFNLQLTYNLTLLDAVSVMAIASIGIVLPSPGGVGTYHYFVKQALLFLSAIPAVTGLAYAIITHAVMLGVVTIVTLFMMILDRDKTTGLSNILSTDPSVE